MAKEMMIVFVYDTECCQNEEDDPADAVLYFHPTWVSDTQKFSLCGQLMGTAHFLRETFGRPNVVSLQNGKFVLKEFGRFVLAVGTDRNVSQSLLEHRAELLSSLLRLFHCDIQTIYDQFSASGQYKNMSEKLYHIFETYLPILQYNGNIFQNMPISKLPKSASNIFLEAMHTLQSCQRSAGVLGGSILYHNKVIATQMYSKLVKNLILTDPHRIKCTAESIPVKFHVPVGCQLITIYIPQCEYDELLDNSERIQAMCVNQDNVNGNAVNGSATAVNGMNAYPSIQFKKKIMKRDKSMVFTNIPEEHAEHTEATASTSYNANKVDGDQSKSEPKNNENLLKFTPQPATARPNHLPLRFKNVTSKEIPESGFSSSITFDEHDSFPQFIGRTSVCSTPMTENKVLHGNILPICSAVPFNEKNALPKNNSSKSIIVNESLANNQITPKEQKNINCNQELVKRTDSKFFDLSDRLVNNTAGNPFAQQVRRNSLVDITEAFRKFSKHLSLRPISTGFANFMHECDYIADGRIYTYGKDQAIDDSSIDYDADAIDDVVPNNRYRTITDPTYPVFNSFGKPISRYLFDEMNSQLSEHEINRKNVSSNSFASFDEQPQTIRNDLKSADNESKVEKAIKSLEKPQMPPNNNINRKSLSLPLKSLNGDTKNNSNYNSTAAAPDSVNTKNIFDKPDERRKLNGIQLTPLISKLSILAMSEERTNGFSSWDTTPGIEMATPLDNVKIFRRRSSMKADETDQVSNSVENQSTSEASDDGELKKVELFICGQNNMTMLLVMKESFGQKHEHIQAMFDVCVSKLPRLESNLNQILNINMNGDKTDGGYSFFCVDREWDTLSRGGPWSNPDLNSIEYIRDDLRSNPKLHNITVRGDESVIYGHQNIGLNVFYKQSAQSLCGLPAPVDAMGTISKHARRSLERDHSVILF